MLPAVVGVDAGLLHTLARVVCWLNFLAIKNAGHIQPALT